MVTDYDAMSILDTPEIEEEEIVANPRISVAEASETYGKFVIGPLDPGYGVTLGNPLRRVLYNSLTGSAITWVKIEGILHEYSNIENVKEEVSEILLMVCFVYPFFFNLLFSALPLFFFSDSKPTIFPPL